MDTESKQTANSTILIVDDNPANLDVLRHVLEPEGYRILAAMSGEESLNIVRRAQPDLILLDVMMQGLDGFTTCRRIKEIPSAARVPLLFVTAKTEIEAVTRGFEVGGVDYIAKPFNKEEVKARVRTHLELSALTRRLAKRNEELEQALTQIQTLSGMLPICAHCKKIRDDEGYWKQVEVYVGERSDATFSHGICPDCIKNQFPEFARL